MDRRRRRVARRRSTSAGTLDEIAASEAEVAAGRHPERPFVLFVQYAAWDPSRAPAGKATAWAYCHVPAGSTVDMTDRIEAQVERFAPGFRDLILARATHAPAAMEAYDANYVGGDINGGIQDIRQLALPAVAVARSLSRRRRALPVLVVDAARRRRPRDGRAARRPLGAAARAAMKARHAPMRSRRPTALMSSSPSLSGGPTLVVWLAVVSAMRCCSSSQLFEPIPLIGLLLILVVASFGIVGAIVATRLPGNAIGWILWASGTFMGWSVAANTYANESLERYAGTLPGTVARGVAVERGDHPDPVRDGDLRAIALSRRSSSIPRMARRRVVRRHGHRSDDVHQRDRAGNHVERRRHPEPDRDPGLGTAAGGVRDRRRRVTGRVVRARRRVGRVAISAWHIHRTTTDPMVRLERAW